jgi:methylenetetrahydrofolate dehydrogenase (NADP+)/methenyltetrahydrofolate cyclohydrolase
LYSVIPHQKEIEGHIPGSSFHFPLSLAVLAGIKYVILKELHKNYIPGEESIVHFSNDREPLSEYLSGKNIVVVGRGITGGRPIGKILSDLNVPFTMINSKTATPETYYKNADIIITAVGKKILKPSMIKKGVVLLNVGLRKENGKLKGDYDEDEIKDIASYYTETPGGLGPLDVLYLYKNLYDASNL